MPPTLVDYANLSPAERESLAQTVALHGGLDDIFAWGRTQSPPVHPSDVIKQDEFSHDVLLRLNNGLWLAYGTT
jgi:hypothetical protein